MFTIRVAACIKNILPQKMLMAIDHQRDLGDLDGLIHIKDDIVRETDYGWEMIGYWGKPEEVGTRDSLVERLEEKLYSSEDLRELVSTIWDVFIENYSDVDLFREDVLNALRDPDAIRSLLCVLNRWSDRLGE